ncbi:hypothetical protein RIF25_14830 [Thermosynechococcaceae cyanobacterium BACA0444]|uniref:Uncharacterized protein n=1 Tax=Pseudocalidococcus azoricus BACA0444 TaxID=2918990 RepID=A0AAE4FW79_9CYAN|nr:hypothetical protein [Pseudocalidococcus azoricus]MDS3862075.1 hypothetical protein [Pseudocalidococcus azoricus BACA0444]
MAIIRTGKLLSLGCQNLTGLETMNSHQDAPESKVSRDQSPWPGCLAPAAGCLVTVIIFPFTLLISGWLAFTMGPMGCAFPKNCSQAEKGVKGIVSLVILMGGGFGVPLTVGALVGFGIKAMEQQTGSRSRARENSEKPLP